MAIEESDVGANIVSRLTTEARTDGRCMDSRGNLYEGVTANNVGTEADCLALLIKLRMENGVQGAQFSEATKCRILFDSDSGSARDEMLSHDKADEWGLKIDGEGG